MPQNDVQHAVNQAWDYIQRRVNKGERAPLGTAAWREAVQAVDAAAQRGDVVATQAACRAWWALLFSP